MTKLRNRHFLIALSVLQLLAIVFAFFWIHPQETRRSIDEGLVEDTLMVAAAGDRTLTVNTSEQLPQHSATHFALFDSDWQRVAGSGTVPAIDVLRGAEVDVSFETVVDGETLRGRVSSVADGSRIYVGR